ncbi:MAG TPA: hypothetical protein VF940_03135, partial [Streptosporangiaceae bacterium]
MDHLRHRTGGSCRRRLLAAGAVTLAGILASACAAQKAASEPNASRAAYDRLAGHGASHTAVPVGHSGGTRSA